MAAWPVQPPQRRRERRAGVKAIDRRPSRAPRRTVRATRTTARPRGATTRRPACGREPLGDHRLRGRPRERRLADEHLVQHASERVEVAPPVHRLAGGLLGAHVRRACRPIAPICVSVEPVRRCGVRQRLADPEVGDERVPLVQQDVLGLDVAVDDVVTVRVVERVGDLARDAGRLLDRQLRRRARAGRAATARPRSASRNRRSRPPPRVEQRQDVRMAEPRRDLDLAQEALAPERLARSRACSTLIGDVATVPQIAGEKHRRHAPFPKHAVERIPIREGKTQPGQQIRVQGTRLVIGSRYDNLLRARRARRPNRRCGREPPSEPGLG